MRTSDSGASIARLFSELIHGTETSVAFALNRGDVGLLRSLEMLSAAEASRTADAGASIAAHAQHLRYGLSLMNRWAAEGGDPFTDASWDAAWNITTVDEPAWEEIQGGLREEAERWLEALKTPRDVSPVEFTGMVSSVAHLAYHLGAIRQISKTARGPANGTFV